eukprot:TRINITY_DN23512_c0_g1_i1.p1 TRINITY_DN23512_c0_g1~~TRINITY_DN23512_c0_g1_i1.p1  ORF type:complete len:166 (+),score=50.29 TRINITY_DN23512_c0_g1_i1:94-591(+)
MGKKSKQTRASEEASSVARKRRAKEKEVQAEEVEEPQAEEVKDLPAHDGDHTTEGGSGALFGEEELCDAGKVVRDSNVGLLEAALTPGIHSSMILWLNAIFLLLISILLLSFMLIGFSIHIAIMMGIVLLLFVTVHWVLGQLDSDDSPTESKPNPKKQKKKKKAN